MHGIDWNAAGAEVTAHLQALIRIDTTNPPGHETEAARYLAAVLEGEGFEAEITESAPGRGNVTTRWEGAESRRCCCSATPTWSPPTPTLGPVLPSAARSTTASSGAGAPST